MADITNQLQAAAGAAGGGEAPATGYNFYIAGSSVWGETGEGLASNSTTPKEIQAGSTWVDAGVTNSGQNYYLVKSDGTLWSIGQNFSGQVGDNTTTFRTNDTFVQIGSGLGSFQYVLTHNGGGFARESGGSMYCWGANTNGMLGTNDTTNRSSPVAVFLTFGTWPSDKSRVGIGSFHWISPSNTNYLFGCGRNSNGELGVGDTVDRSSPVWIGSSNDWSKAAAGNDSTCAIKTNGTLWAWGANVQGQLGLNSTTSYSSPVQVGADSDWANVTVGFFSALAIKTDGTLWGWGSNTVGQLGDGTTTTRSSPVQIGALSNWSQVATGVTGTIAIKTDGTLWTWGANANAQLGDGSFQNSSSPIQVGTATNWTEISTSGSNTVVLNSNSDVYVLGTYFYAPRYVSSPVQVGSINNWLSASFGASYVLAIKTDNTLWAWGLNTVGQLGTNNLIGYSSPVQVGKNKTWSVVSTAARTSLAVKTDGTLWSWGDNTAGPLGDNSAVTKSSPVQVGALTDWSTVFCCGFSASSFAIKTNNTLWAWGNNPNGILGLGFSGGSRSSPVQVGALTDWAQISGTTGTAGAIKTNGTLWTWGAGASGQRGSNSVTNVFSPVQVGALTTWAHIAGTGNAFAAVKTDGTLWVWGQNNFGQLGLNDTTNRSSPVQVGALTNWSKVQSASSNGGFIALKTDGTIWAWGANFAGNLGLSNLTNYSSPVQIGSLNTIDSLAVNNFGSNSGFFE
jgi:alpha-tubulin suppressor-like RCC1 family protein